MKKLFLLIVLFVFVSGYTLLAQTIVITGTVTSSVQGEGAVIGASVSVKGTTVGAITGVDGKFSLTAPQDATTLVFSYIGMKKQEVEIAGRKVIDIVMEPELLGLNEVVVTAFGIKRQAKELGVATAQVTDKQLTQAGVSNVVNGLTAKVSGLQINTVNNGVNPDTRITLRGNRHFLASNQALIVLDGVPVSADYLNSINPNDIGNVNVLKGASASALYGNDASNGVLVITTKRGSGDKPVIKISNTTTFENISYMPDLQTRFGAGSGEDTVNSLPNYTFWVGPDRNTDPRTSYENQSYGPEFNGQMVILGGKLVDGSYQMIPYSAVKNGKKKFFDTGISTQNDISYSVGDDKNSFYLSAQDVNTTGTIPDDKNRRTGVRMAGSRTSGIFHADYTIGFSQTNTNTSGGDMFQQRPVYWNVLNTPAEVDLTLYKDIENNKFANINGYFNAYYPNPYWAIKNSRNISRTENVLGSAIISLNPAQWIDISYRAGLTYNSNSYNTYRNGVVVNAYMSGDPWQAGDSRTGSPFAGVSGDQISNSMILTGDFLVQLNHKIGDFNGKMILGNSMYSNKYRYVGVANNSLVIPFLYNVSNRLGEPGVGETVLNRNSIGLFGDLTLGYKDFAFLHASARNDWDSRLTKDNRSFFYPGVDASVILSDAIPALKDNAFLSFAKIRGGWSQTGQISLDNWYATLPSFSPAAGFPYGTTAGFGLSATLSNPLLKPELTQEIEGGFELSFIKNRFHLTVNAYKSNTKDQTIPATLSYATGYASAYINAGELQTSGLETDFKLTPVINLGDFDWNLTVSYAYNTSKVISILADLNELPIGNVSYAIVGQQFPAIKVTDLKRDPQGRIIVDAVTGFPKKDPALKQMGHGNPNHILGIVNTFNFKGLSLNVVADYRSGHNIVNAVGNALDFTGTSWHSAQNGRQNFVIPNSVINTGTDAAPVYVVNTNVVTRNAARSFWVSSDYPAVQSTYLTSAAFWKLREVSLSYDIPVQNIFGGAIKGAQIGIVGRNLLMLRPRTNTWTDPEFNVQGGNSNAVGYTNENQTPPTRIYGFSVKLTF
ncbi:MAG: SusC/RagA family TonB-linked outer membrane protein [Bacteroidetes bacterium]|nr:MAG: SusC/RagA family TonB-linked outer membrane protein [Bacteroidota bacterium]